ncbi:MAG: protein arginine kinase [Clostridiales bacterium]|nr:protein arginine kinase [Clostridiales bacterium]
MKNEIISSRIRLARNLNEYPFPNSLNKAQAVQITERVRTALAPIIKGYTFANMSDMDEVTKLSLVENHIISPDAAKKKNCALFMANDGRSEILINEEDHVRIQTVFPGDNLEEAYSLADRLDNLLDERLSFAFSEKYGYLTACLTNTGTGLRASYMVHLPMLEKTKQIKALQNEVGRFGMVIRGIYGEGSEPLGSLYQISNQITLGKSEEEIIKDLKNITNQIIKREEELEEKIKENNDFSDMVYRSLGILKYCKKISSQEAMNHLSNVKLGISSGIIKDREDNIYNIMADIQSGNMCKRAGDIMESDKRDILRAEYLNNKL